MSSWDTAILRWANSFAQTSSTFDAAVVTVAFNDLLKGLFAFTIFWGLWASANPEEVVRRRREVLLSTLCAVLIALAVNRVLGSTLPFRPRPLHDPTFGFRPPLTLNRFAFNNLSSFPSDTAVLFLGLAAGIFRTSRPLGVLLLLHATVVVLAPRVYLGLHYPSDLLGGLALALVLVLPLTSRRVAARISAPFLRWHDRSPGTFMTLFFLATSLTALLFDPLIKLIT